MQYLSMMQAALGEQTASKMSACGLVHIGRHMNFIESAAIVQVALQHLVYVEQTAKQIRREVAAKEKAIAEARSERLAAGEAPSQGPVLRTCKMPTFNPSFLRRTPANPAQAECFASAVVSTILPE